MRTASAGIRLKPSVHARSPYPDLAPGDPEVQTRRALETVVDALESAGAERDHVVRTRIYVTDVDDWETIGDVHAEFFADVRPAATLVEVSSLVGPEYVVEIEAEAVIPE